MNEELIKSLTLPSAAITSAIKAQGYVIFWGGTDVNSKYYGEVRSPYTQYPDVARDLAEMQIAKWCIQNDIPMLGICRGAQLLNVFHGGSLNQDITNHGGTHIIQTWDGREFSTNSTHHQMMIPPPHAEVLATCNSPSKGLYRGEYKDLAFTYEVIAFPKTKTLCVQYHPEWMDPNSEGVKFVNEMALKYMQLIPDLRESTQYWGTI